MLNNLITNSNPEHLVVHSDGKFYFASVTHIVLWCDGLGGMRFSHECPTRLHITTNNSDIFGATLLVGGVVMRSISFKVRLKSLSFHLALMVFCERGPLFGSIVIESILSLKLFTCFFCVMLGNICPMVL
jgi:hypothetical protein